MALIKCTECGQTVSDKAAACPNCGCPISQDKGYPCEECGTLIPENASECPNCGCPIHNVRKSQERVSGIEASKTKGWIWVVVIAFICIVVGGGFFLLNKVNSIFPQEGSEDDPQIEIILYNDDTGEIRDSNNTRLTGFHIYGRSGTIILHLNSSVNFLGTSTNKIYLYKGKAYANRDDYIYNEGTTGIPYIQKEEGTEIHYLVYNTSGNKMESVAKTIDNKIREATTIEEVRRLINGTTWHYTENLDNSQIGCWLKVEFKNGHYTSYYANPSDGHWTKSKTGTYKIDEGRYSNTGEKYISVEWEGDIITQHTPTSCEFKMTTDSFNLHVFSSLLDYLNTMMYGHYYNAEHGRTHYTGQMKYGDYTW